MARVSNQFYLVNLILAAYLLNICASLEYTKQQLTKVHKFTIDDNLPSSKSQTITKRSTRHQRQKRETGDATCQLQEKLFLQDVKAEDFIFTVSANVQLNPFQCNVFTKYVETRSYFFLVVK